MAEKTSIEKMRDFILTCPFLEDFTKGILIDWHSQNKFGLMPAGQTTIRRVEDIMGGVIAYKQYNFSLYANNFTIDDVIRIETIGFLDRFTEWIEEQSVLGLAPQFGDNPSEEEITAQNGMLFQLYDDGQTGRYQLQIAVTFEKHYNKE
ncbi:MAG: hypothetical protein IJ279_04170 [Clostridia bacterium]|nr:hypothetical protein [Clostridia bacterium]